MEQKTLFEQLIGTYHEESGYIIPALRLPEEKVRTITLAVSAEVPQSYIHQFSHKRRNAFNGS